MSAAGSNESARREAPVDEAAQRRANLRLASLLGAAAFALFTLYIVLHLK